MVVGGGGGGGGGGDSRECFLHDGECFLRTRIVFVLSREVILVGWGGVFLCMECFCRVMRESVFFMMGSGFFPHAEWVLFSACGVGFFRMWGFSACRVVFFLHNANNTPEWFSQGSHSGALHRDGF